MLKIRVTFVIRTFSLLYDNYWHKNCYFVQIEAADKQLRATRRFLDEQAREREMERDEEEKQIHFLQEQLKEREREKERDMRISSEVKHCFKFFHFFYVKNFLLHLQT